jgi:hypothetical protein
MRPRPCSPSRSQVWRGEERRRAGLRTLLCVSIIALPSYSNTGFNATSASALVVSSLHYYRERHYPASELVVSSLHYYRERHYPASEEELEYNY